MLIRANKLKRKGASPPVPTPIADLYAGTKSKSVFILDCLRRYASNREDDSLINLVKAQGISTFTS